MPGMHGHRSRARAAPHAHVRPTPPDFDAPELTEAPEQLAASNAHVSREFAILSSRLDELTVITNAAAGMPDGDGQTSG